MRERGGHVLCSPNTKMESAGTVQREGNFREWRDDQVEIQKDKMISVKYVSTYLF